jgi:endonuclease I
MRLFLLFIFLPFALICQVPVYYSSIDFTKTGNELKSQLTTLISSTHTTQIPYTSSVSTDTWDAIKLTDLDPNNSSVVFLLYGWNDNDNASNTDRTRDKNLSCHVSDCSGLWNREHVFARSLGTPDLGSAGAGSDVHNLRAIDSDQNNMRGNRLFEDAASSSMSYTTGAGNWYPGDEWRGDVARMIMYMYVRYPNQCRPTNVGVGSTSYSNFGDMPNVFLEWNAIDPVSEYERVRNDVLQSLQGNRNPFIDNPLIATRIWNGPDATDTWGGLSIEESVVNQIILAPSTEEGLIRIKNGKGELFHYAIYSPTGQLLNEDHTTEEIQTTTTAKGIYFVQLSSNGFEKTFKIFLN